MSVYSDLYGRNQQAASASAATTRPPAYSGGVNPAYSGPMGWDNIYDWIRNSGQNRVESGRLKPTQIGADVFSTPLLYGAGPGGAATSPVAYATLFQNLLGQGRTDPALMNRQVRDIQMGGQGQQQAVQGELARRGMSRSGVGQALSAAVGQGTEDRIAGVRASEAQLAEQRKRDDLDQFLRMVMDPSLNAYGLTQGVAMQNQQNRQQQNNAYLALLGSLLGGFGGGG